MSDPRRRRQIKTPSGPRKKDAPDLSKYQMSPPPTGRQEVPKPQPKPDPSQQRSSGQRSGGGQRQGGRPVAETKVDEVEVLQVAVAKVGAINPALNPKR